MPAIRDKEYAAVVERERPLIQATAYLLTGDPVQAERVVQLVFAELYGGWPTQANPRLAALRALVRAAATPVHLPWEYRPRVELIDVYRSLSVSEQSFPSEPIVADLGMLTCEHRAVITLESYAGLSITQIAAILGRPTDDVLALVQQARAALVAGHPGRTSDAALVQELKDAIPYEMRESHGSAADLTHGRQLVRRRWIQLGSAALVVVVLGVIAAALLFPTRPPVPQAAPVLPPAAPATQGCDPATQTCRSKILLKWRSEMAEVVASNLDPKGEYFSGFGYAYDSRYDTPGFWTGQGGALALEMFRHDNGATEVYMQVATSQKFAVRCGATTHHKCLSFHSMDGNSYLMTDSTLADGGIEVQFWPRDDEVITVIARNTQRGKTLEIGSGDLINLVQDERLRLPRRCCYRR
jgi:DNA-directed RNA polymerase specialized sigma24 family protein